MAAMFYLFNRLLTMAISKLVKIVLKKNVSAGQSKWQQKYLANIKPVGWIFAVIWGCLIVSYSHYANQSCNPLNINYLETKVKQYLSNKTV
jgi:hypothetical protein